MDEKPQNKELQVGVTANEIQKLKSDIKNIYKSSVEPVVEDKLKKLLLLIKVGKRTGQQQKEITEIATFMSYAFMLDNGTLLTNIANKEEKQYGLLAIRERLIVEYNCQTVAELMLVDQMVAAYMRLMKYESYVNRLPETANGGYSFDQLTINALKESRQQIEQAHRQIEVSLTMLKSMKQPQLKVNVKTENAYFAQNQQVVNEKPHNEPPVETIKPK